MSAHQAKQSLEGVFYDENTLTRPDSLGASDPGHDFYHAAHRMGGGGHIHYRTQFVHNG